MKDKIRQFIYKKNTCLITDILAEFLISFEQAFPILCELYSEKLIKQQSDQTIVSLIKSPKIIERKKAEEKKDEIDSLFDFEMDDDEDEQEKTEDERLSQHYQHTLPLTELTEKIIYEEIFNGSKISRESALLMTTSILYDDQVIESVTNRIKRATDEEIEMFQTGEKCPERQFWDSEQAFEDKIKEVIERQIITSESLPRKDAIQVVKQLLEKAKSPFDGKMVDVYSRLYYEFRASNDEDYNDLIKHIFS